ncbi:hypothetical protein [Microcoleus sp. PH2017_09_SFU_O_A]|uniref:hypothetical protein n=1 Tax=Microcoleus sp. PH2017_09_SFU_O_A TaxID=2798820 RepID=UPI001D68FF8C|nr:hypothetical protein [Microcoleus sp. PH2017_09_SFU_O_A]MCC3449405.1 hypothetical protein [Microcoleus sp. PH2017_09_SFU_O_A]
MLKSIIDRIFPNLHYHRQYLFIGRSSNKKGISHFFAVAIAQSAPFEMVEIDRIVGGKRGWGDARVKRICRKGRSPTH